MPDQSSLLLDMQQRRHRLRTGEPACNFADICRDVRQTAMPDAGRSAKNIGPSSARTALDVFSYVLVPMQLTAISQERFRSSEGATIEEMSSSQARSSLGVMRRCRYCLSLMP
jgi:hypothetical protein